MHFASRFVSSKFFGNGAFENFTKKIYALFENISAICAVYGSFEYTFWKFKNGNFNGSETCDGLSSDIHSFKCNDEYGISKSYTKLSVSTQDF